VSTYEDWTIIKGKTFQRIVRLETLPFVYKAITAITKAAPVAITAVSHGLVSGWRAAVISAGGMRQINAKQPLRDSDFYKVTKVSGDVVTLNAIDSSGYTTYTSGGYLVYKTPVTLTSSKARFTIRDTPEAAAALVALSESSGIVIDASTQTLTLTISATSTAALTFASGVYELEFEDSTGVVYQVRTGAITVEDEVAW